MNRCGTAGVALVVTLCAGCGTMENFARPEDGGPRPMEVYGGVTRSAENVKGLFSGEPIAAAISLFLVPDIALSAIGDTITLPVTVPIAITRAVDDSINDYYFPEKKPAPQNRESQVLDAQSLTPPSPPIRAPSPAIP